MNKNASTPRVGHALLFLGVFAFASITTAQPLPNNIVSQSDYDVIHRGANHRELKREVIWMDESGEEITTEHTYVQLESGMHYLDESGNWQDADPTIEIIDGVAVASRLQQPMVFAGMTDDLNGVVDFLTNDKKRLRASPLALAYFDPFSGQDAIIATVKPVAGVVIPPNQVIYKDCFDNIEADVLITVRKDGFEQDIILREHPPAPEVFGFLNEVARLEVLTEFFEAPEPIKQTRVVDSVEDPALRALMAEPDVVDEVLSFGEMRMGSGRGFLLDEAEDPVRINKHWESFEDGRKILFESVDYFHIEEALDQLPRRQANALAPASGDRAGEQLSYSERARHAAAQVAQTQSVSKPKRTVPRMALSVREVVGEGIQVAAHERRKGFVLDYTTLGSSLSSYTFEGSNTYYCSGTVNAAGTTTFEGGTVVKFAASSRINIDTSVICETSMFRPAILTAKDDDSVGETISGSNGDPGTGAYATYALYFDLNWEAASPQTLKYMRIGYASTGVYFTEDSDSGHLVTHTQFHHNTTALKMDLDNGSAANLRNVLFSDNTTALHLTQTTLNCEHVTVDKATTFHASGGSSTVNLKNSLLVAVTTAGSYSGSNNATDSTSSNVFETVGAGARYLKAGSSHRNAGTTSINATLADDLREMTTYPPLVVAGDITVDTVWYPQAQRDIDTPDLGYHYAPIDYGVDVLVKDATLTVLPGTSVVSHNYRAIELQDGGHLECVGTPTAYIHLGRNYGPQENPDIWGTRTYTERSVITRNDGSNPPTANIRFTKFDGISAGGWHFYSNNAYWKVAVLNVQDCEFRGEDARFGGGINTPVSAIELKNNLFEDVDTEMRYQGVINGYHNLFVLGSVLFDRWSTAGTWTFTDNAFHSVSLTHTGTIANSYNGYLGSGQGTMSGSSGNDRVLTPFGYATGDLGEYYQSSTTLANYGSQTADSAGLYHYTTLTANTKDSSTVDIGYHYVSLDAYDNPNDDDGDGVPDYIEDADGDNVLDSGETNWTVATDLGLFVRITRPSSQVDVP